ncbi:Pentatricopeptide repeat-containing protein [Seminavis robusta]|uniref:Pentatricopeptide repeat-containing protein n=1 Tax=Seminavis robusta TaxID=568900 RepID=A0A9N8EKC5_9STRA|nr:Pentatricopeptide repeat-containing protein [Seminavis robusta]|eukprot:Sro1141_g245720.1 Pentatricopeptide repeat-containing protein (204) ;mRNA; r:35413-36125
MTAFGKSRQPNAPYYVEDLLREMHEEYVKTRDPRIRPTSRTYNNCVNAWAQSTLPGSAARIMEWIVHMQSNAEREGRRYLGPNKWTFNAFLQSLSKSGEPTIGEDAEEVLNQMMEYYRKGWTELKPDVLTFTTAIHCIAVSGKPDALERSLAIVRRMEDFHEQGFGDVRPNCYTYNCVINAAAKSRRPGKPKLPYNSCEGCKR